VSSRVPTVASPYLTSREAVDSLKLPSLSALYTLIREHGLPAHHRGRLVCSMCVSSMHGSAASIPGVRTAEAEISGSVTRVRLVDTIPRCMANQRDSRKPFEKRN
jgi:hypothetical protein